MTEAACKPFTPIDWIISESTLAVLWDSVFQRVIVYLWYIEYYSAAHSADINTKLHADVITHLGTFNNIPPIDPDDSVAGKRYFINMMIAIYKDPDVSPFFRESLIKLMGYFTAKVPPMDPVDYNNFVDNIFDGTEDFSTSIPMYFIDTPGFDYILSNKGIELAIPRTRPSANDLYPDIEKEEFEKNTYRLYEKRKTGQFAVLLTPEDTQNGQSMHFSRKHSTVRLNNADNNIEEALREELTTHITEIRFNACELPPFIQEILSSIAEAGNLEEPVECDNITSLEDLISSIFNIEELLSFDEDRLNRIKDIIDQLSGVVNTIRGGFTGVAGLLGPAEIAGLIDDLVTEVKDLDPPSISLQIDTIIQSILRFFYCYIQELFEQEIPQTIHEVAQGRDWYISGSIFRRIANEMPRLKARIWLEDLNGISATKNQYVLNVDTGCRLLFGLLLEITLPPCAKMYFCGASLPPQPPLEGDEDLDAVPVQVAGKRLLVSPIEGLDVNDYNKNQIYIHKNGITLPYIGDPPTQDDIYASWKNGVAANPFYTDSSETC